MLFVLQESIDEGNEEELEGVPPAGSWRSRHAQPGSPSTPVKHLSTPNSSMHSQDLAAELSGQIAEEDSETALSPQTHWDREHSRFQEHQQQLEQRRQLARAVHAAIREANQPGSSSSPSPRQSSPGAAESVCTERSPSFGLFAAEQPPSPRESRGSSSSSVSMGLMQQTSWQAAPDDRHSLAQVLPDEGFRASLGGLKAFIGRYQQQQQQHHQQQGTGSSRGNMMSAESCQLPGLGDLLCSTAGILMAGCSPAAAGEHVSLDNTASLQAWAQQQPATGTGSAPASPCGSVCSNTASTAAQTLAQRSGVLADADVTAAAAATLPAVGGDDSEAASSVMQQQQQTVHGPAWDMADYEEEFRQLSQQLQVGSCSVAL